MSEENNTLNPDELEKVTGGQRSAYHYFWDRVKVCTPEEWAQVLDGVNYALSLGYDLDWL